MSRNQWILLYSIDLKDISKKFNLEIIPFEEDQKDIFQIDATTQLDSVSLKGTDGIMLAHAFQMFQMLNQLNVGTSSIIATIQCRGEVKLREIIFTFRIHFLWLKRLGDRR